MAKTPEEKDKFLWVSLAVMKIKEIKWLISIFYSETEKLNSGNY